MRCPHCKNQLLQKSGTQVRARVEGPITWEGEGLEAHARCYWCKGQVTLPARLEAMDQVPAAVFVLPVQKKRA